MLTANDVEPTPMLTLKAEAGESRTRGIELLGLSLRHHKCLETFKHHNKTKTPPSEEYYV
jgi:hypothetical protein